MKQSAIVALAASLFRLASPASVTLKTSPLFVKASSESVAASFPISELHTYYAGPRFDTTAPQSSFRPAVKRQEFPASLRLCHTVDCGICFTQDLSQVIRAGAEGDCFTGNFEILSVAIDQPSNEGLPFVVGVGPASCAEPLVDIATVNECFNLNFGTGVVFDSFVLHP
ncbi:hypothetical protein OH77DRAFT_844289 [Trametes cingulata]|nr:hypothetical protein OH77DRAFT_844289 [Trametes cingulata]